MHGRKAMELSLNFIVILIISIVIFGFGIKFISTLSSKATELHELTLEDLDEKIGSLACEGSERVCVSTDGKTIQKADFDFFGVKIINILDSQEFDITVSRPSPSGYTKTKADIMSDGLVAKPQSRAVFIGKNEEKDIGIGIEVPANAVSGTYIFNVNIRAQDGNPYSNVQKLYVNVP